MNFASSIRLLCVITVLVACNDSTETPNYKYEIAFRYHAGHMIFTDLPVEFYFSTTPFIENNGKVFVWSFGDGSTSDKSSEHLYDKPGIYTITLTSENKILADTVIEVIPKPPIMGSPNYHEEGVFFYQDENSNYVVLCKDCSESQFSVGVMTEHFEMKELKQLPNTQHWFFEYASTSRNGFLVPMPPTAIEISNDGTLVTQSSISPGNSFSPTDVLPTENGYKIIGEASGNVVLCEVNQILETQVIKSVKVFDPSSIIPHVYFEDPEVIRIHQTDQDSVGFMNMMVQNLDGTMLLKQLYPYDLGMASFKFQNGYCLFGYDDETFSAGGYIYNFSITDINGNIISTTKVVLSTGDDQATSVGPPIKFIERGEFIYAFFGTMQVLKLAKTGQVLWQKTFATTYDRFRSVIVNKQNNFVMMGEHHYDSETHQFTESFGARDIIFIELDEDGNYLFAK